MKTSCIALLIFMSGCGLANGLGHVEHPFYSDIPGYCAYCGRDGDLCAVGDDFKLCESVSTHQDCDFEEQDRDAIDVFLSPAVDEFFDGDAESDNDCSEDSDEMGKRTIELIVYDREDDSPFNQPGPLGPVSDDLFGRVEFEGGEPDDSCNFARDDECDEPNLCSPGTDGTDCGRTKPFVEEWSSSFEDRDDEGSVYSVTLDFCVQRRFDSVLPLRVTERDGDEGNVICVVTYGSDDEEDF
jgi:hypothetical protein